MVQVTVETTGRLLVGSEIGAALTALEALRPDVIGLELRDRSDRDDRAPALPLAARTHLSLVPAPNAGLPSIVDGHTHYDLTPDALAEAHARFLDEFGLNIVGGCCGTTPAHLRAVVERIGSRAPVARTPEHEPSCSSIYSPVTFHQELAYLAVGERTNANGSRKFRDAMLEADWDTCVQMARDQVKEGAHVLDVCVDYVGRDGAADMHEIASRFATQAALPLVFDSTEPQVLEAGLQHSGGKAILNSANLEEGEAAGKRFDRVMSLASEYGAAVICLAIDEEGQARTADWKLQVCRRIYDLAIERYGIEPTDLIFDMLTFPLGSGAEDLRRDGIETIEAIRRARSELPGSSTILGLSNISFGLKPAIRHVFNSVFLHECREAGLDAAIVHAARILPMHKIDEQARELALDLVYDRRRDGYDPLTELMALFEGVDADDGRAGRPVGLARRATPRAPHHRRQPRRARTRPRGATVVASGTVDRQRCAPRGHEGGRRALRSGRDAAPVRAPERGDDEGGGGLPRTAHGEGWRRRQGPRGARHGQGRRPRHREEPRRHHPHEQRLRGPQHRDQGPAVGVRGEGDGGAGRRHRDERPAREEHPDHAREPRRARTPRASPRSRSSSAAPRCTRTYVERDLREVYDGRLFYGKDAFEGLHTMDQLMEAKRTGVIDPDFGRAPGGRILPPRRSEMEAERAVTAAAVRSDVAADVEIFTPPFLGPRVAKGVALDDIAGYVNETALYRNQWQFRPDKTIAENDTDFKDRIRAILRAELDEAKADGWLVPAVVWGYFPVNSDGNDVIVWTDDERRNERLRFTFPRQRSDRHLCISDFFRSVESGDADYAAFHVVTVGERGERARA